MVMPGPDSQNKGNSSTSKMMKGLNSLVANKPNILDYLLINGIITPSNKGIGQFLIQNGIVRGSNSAEKICPPRLVEGPLLGRPKRVVKGPSLFSQASQASTEERKKKANPNSMFGNSQNSSANPSTKMVFIRLNEDEEKLKSNRPGLGA